MTTEHGGSERRAPRRGFRLTSRLFWDMAIYMVWLGLGVGLIFPPFAVLLGVPDAYAERPIFRSASVSFSMKKARLGRPVSWSWKAW